MLYYFAMPANPLSRFCDEIAAALASSDQHRFEAAMRSLAAATPRAAPDDVQDAVARLAGILATIQFSRGVDLVQLAGAMTDYGPMPGELLPVLVRRAAEAMEQAAQFAAIYGADGESLPDPEDLSLVQPVVARLRDRKSVV